MSRPTKAATNGSGRRQAAVLVTGIGRQLGAHLAERLAADPRVGRVYGVDGPGARREARAVAGVEVLDIGLQTPELTKVLTDLRVRAVAHLSIATSADHQAGGRAAMKEHNVIGTMQLLAACQQAPALR